MHDEHGTHFRKLFEAGVIFKGIFAVLETTGGVLLFFVSTDYVYAFVRLFTFVEISEDPVDVVANYLLQAAHTFTIEAKLFIALYLFTRGIVKLFLITSLLRNKLWAYPVSLGIFGLFVLYDVYRYIHTHSPFTLSLALLDFLVLGLIYHEYGVARKVRHI